MRVKSDGAYLGYSLDFKQEELECRDKLMAVLPNSIIDCHAHCNLRKHTHFSDPIILNHPASTFRGFSLEASKKVQKLFYPGKFVQTLRFPIPLAGVNFKDANSYLLSESASNDKVAICGIPNNVEYTISMLKDERVTALKMYSYSICPPAERIYQFFTPEILGVAEDVDVPIILHVPVFLSQCMEDIIIMLKEFPRLKIVLAHLGNPNYTDPGLATLYGEIANFPGVYLDTALVSCKSVIEAAFDVFGFERIMFGSDEPFHMLRTIEYDNPELGQRLITKFPYHWMNRGEYKKYKHLAQNAVHLHWTSLAVLIDTIREKYGNGNSFELVIKKVFHDNAESFFGF